MITLGKVKTLSCIPALAILLLAECSFTLFAQSTSQSSDSNPPSSAAAKTSFKKKPPASPNSVNAPAQASATSGPAASPPPAEPANAAQSPASAAQQTSPAAAQQSALSKKSEVVWVNTESGVYHKPGTRYYGKTKKGKYMTEADAIKAGYRPARRE